MKVSITHILWSSDFALHLKHCYTDLYHTCNNNWVCDWDWPLAASWSVWPIFALRDWDWPLAASWSVWPIFALHDWDWPLAASWWVWHYSHSMTEIDYLLPAGRCDLYSHSATEIDYLLPAGQCDLYSHSRDFEFNFFRIRPKRNIPVFPVSLPTLIFAPALNILLYSWENKNFMK